MSNAHSRWRTYVLSRKRLGELNDQDEKEVPSRDQWHVDTAQMAQRHM